MDQVERNAPWRDHGDGRTGTQRWTEKHLAGGDQWSPWTEATFSRVHLTSHDDVVDRVRSVSHIAVLPRGAQQAVLDEIRTILRENPETSGRPLVGIPYRVDAMYCQRLR